VVISGFSTGVFTADNTSRIIVPVLHWLFPHASRQALLLMHHYIRKAGHLTEYFILSLLVLRGIRGGNRATRLRLAWALATIAVVACYASLDEFHQSFVPGRTAAVSDVLLDTIGGATAQVVVALVMLWRQMREKQRNEKAEVVNTGA
jgi:VanZ family protein